jgi:hypothetical protein
MMQDVNTVADFREAGILEAAILARERLDRGTEPRQEQRQ